RLRGDRGRQGRDVGNRAPGPVRGTQDRPTTPVLDHDAGRHDLDSARRVRQLAGGARRVTGRRRGSTVGYPIQLACISLLSFTSVTSILRANSCTSQKRLGMENFDTKRLTTNDWVLSAVGLFSFIVSFLAFWTGKASFAGNSVSDHKNAWGAGF